jgi:hypothetical protein
MTFVDLLPYDVRPVRVLVDSKWWNGDLEAYRRKPDGRWLGCVRWSEGLAVTRIGWFRRRTSELLAAESRPINLRRWETRTAARGFVPAGWRLAWMPTASETRGY